MSFDITFSRFEKGELASVNARALRQKFEPYIRKHEPELGFALLRFADGGAELYGLDDLAEGFTISRVTGKKAWDTLFDIAKEFNLTIMAPDCPIAVTTKEALAHLPAEMPPERQVVTSSQALQKTLALS